VRRGHRWLPWACALELLLAPALALADPAAEARFHDELARQHYRARRFEAALAEFFLEQRASPNPRIAFNIALCFQGLGRGDDAFLYFNEYLASQDADPERRAYAQRTIEALLPQLARVQIQSTPAGAEVYVDRKEHGSYGRTPIILALAPGEHTVTLELAGHRETTGNVLAQQGELALLELAPPKILGQLRVSGPPGAAVSVRSSAGETVGEGSAPLELGLPPAGYEVHVRSPGHQLWSGLADVVADEQREVVAQPLPVPLPSGDLTVTSNVPGALVELNGEPAAFSPAVLSNVPAGTLSLRVLSPARVPWAGTVEVAADSRSWVTVSLEEPPTVQRSPATWVVGGLGAASLAAAGIFGILASSAHDDFRRAAPGSDRTALRERGLTLNVAADVSLVSGVAATTAAVLLYYLTGEVQGRDSSAVVTRGAP
jgi:hypothetical protein